MRSLSLFVIVLLVSASGCALCPPGYLEDYAAVGGKWERSDPACGRVGSIFSDPNSTMYGGDTAVVTPETYYGDETYYEDGTEYGDDVIILDEEF